MNRFLGAVVVSLIGCAGADAGRCTRDSQCPGDAFCDRDTGVCVRGSDGSGGGSGGFFGGFSGGSGGGSAAQNRASLPCKSDADCPGGTCVGGDNPAMSTGVCLNECGDSTTADQSKCRAGTTCTLPPPHSVFGAECMQYCQSSTECGARMRCQWMADIGHSICTNYNLGFAGGGCSADNDCTSGLYCDTSVSGGYCTASCSSAACSAPGTCVNFDSTTKLCMATCYSVGTQSTCRAGQMCRALQGVSYGYCL